jgi:hypothetical protein
MIFALKNTERVEITLFKMKSYAKFSLSATYPFSLDHSKCSDMILFMEW